MCTLLHMALARYRISRVQKISCQYLSREEKLQGKALTEEDKAAHTLISRIRSLGEHVISGVTRCRIVQEVFRNTTSQFSDQVMEIACGLHNFRATLRSALLE